MNHYQINLRSIACAGPRNPLEALQEAVSPPTSLPSPLASLTSGLDSIKNLGVELLHVMPPFVMGQEGRKGIGSPYAVADYENIDPEFGTKAEWFELVRQAHALNMKLIVGFMPNHTARDHVWARQDPKNHLRKADGTLDYDFDWSDTGKLDYTYPPLRRRVIETLQRWLQGEDKESGIDGYRMDMAHMINDLSFWDECIPELRQTMGSRDLLLLAECYGFERNLDLFARGFQAAYDDDFYKIAQYGYARDAQGRSRLVLDPEARGNEDFAPRLTDWERGGISAAVTGLIQDHLHRAPDRWLARYVDNHDEGRGLYRFGEDACRVLMDLAACMPQSIVFTLCGQEAGAMNRPPIHEYFNLCDKGYRSIQSDGSFKRVEGVEFEGNTFFRTAEKRSESISAFRERFALRKKYAALTRGSWCPLEVEDVSTGPQKTVVAFTRQSGSETLHCLFNLGHEDRSLKALPSGCLIYGSGQGDTLSGFETRIYLG